VCSPPGLQLQQQQAASQAIINAAASATSVNGSASGMHSLLKCGWVVAKVSDFGLSTHTQPEETHVSSVHAVRVSVSTHHTPACLHHPSLHSARSARACVCVVPRGKVRLRPPADTPAVLDS
jgi:hypothetical protein